MSNIADFDAAALNYDVEFSHTLIGKAQRRQVWKLLKNARAGQENCLELNGGTGQDALKLYELGYKVKTTDNSHQMLAIARQKLRGLAVEVAFLDCRNLESKDLTDKHLVFSNFGGLNCLSPNNWKQFAQTLQALPIQAHCVFVIMSRDCFWEKIYFAWKRKKPWNRKSMEPVQAHVSGQSVKTWYYSTQEIIAFMGSNFQLIKKRPIGFLVPPSYLEPFFAKHKWLFKVLKTADLFFTKLSFLANAADHFYLDFKRKNNG